MNNQNENIILNTGENPNPQKGNPMQPEIKPQQPQPGKSTPEIQQPSKDLPQKNHPDEVNYPSTKPQIKEPNNSDKK